MTWTRAKCVEVPKGTPKAQGEDGKDGPEVVATNLSGQINVPAKSQNLQGTGVKGAEGAVESTPGVQVVENNDDGWCGGGCNILKLLGTLSVDWRVGIPLLYKRNISFIMGTRRTDYGCESYKDVESGSVDNFTFKRINPLLNWTYGDVWNFIRFFKLEYCELYDQGYTSIGRYVECM
ncbi:hypothetical protein BEWA_046240 [Theileria equi strain WA]|uniref:FAD synthase n=1 Tax=Theileria equi strain WA TaxID=1537102 RepID=L1LA89_THEEQ|nr:hypothetical protein BEWA_046240 [Theileria equi strain WA]EKX72160.1 hypothetical protein BEWA_046240 [Theileria equi strain WA]|eukprot:XP_004831612.1 hypothetical protein BEWA_046240 [Theileria equi strain WA]